MSLVTDLLVSAQALSPKTGDVLLFKWSEDDDPEAIYQAALSVKEKLLDLGIKIVLVSTTAGVSLSHIPREEMAEQGYLWKADTRQWLESHMPLGKRAPLLAMFDKEYGTDAANA